MINLPCLRKWSAVDGKDIWKLAMTPNWSLRGGISDGLSYWVESFWNRSSISKMMIKNSVTDSELELLLCLSKQLWMSVQRWKINSRYKFVWCAEPSSQGKFLWCSLRRITNKISREKILDRLFCPVKALSSYSRETELLNWASHMSRILELAAREIVQ